MAVQITTRLQSHTDPVPFSMHGIAVEIDRLRAEIADFPDEIDEGVAERTFAEFRDMEMLAVRKQAQSPQDWAYKAAVALADEHFPKEDDAPVSMGIARQLLEAVASGQVEVVPVGSRSSHQNPVSSAETCEVAELARKYDALNRAYDLTFRETKVKESNVGGTNARTFCECGRNDIQDAMDAVLARAAVLRASSLEGAAFHVALVATLVDRSVNLELTPAERDANQRSIERCLESALETIANTLGVPADRLPGVDNLVGTSLGGLCRIEHLIGVDWKGDDKTTILEAAE